MLAVGLLTTAQAWALTEYADPTSLDIAFYTFALTGIAFSAAIITAYREYDWLVYVGLSLLLLINVAAIDGTLTLAFGNDPFVIWVVPYLVTSCTAVYGFWMIALRLEQTHTLGKLKRLFIALAMMTAVFPLSSVLWLEKISLEVMWVPVNILFFGMIVAQILPPLSWPVTDVHLSRVIRVFPIVVGLFAIGTYGLHLTGSRFSQALLNDLNQIAMLLFAGFSLTIVVWQAFISAREKDNAERNAIEAAKNEAELKLSLLQAEQNYQRAQSAAAAHRSRLATVSHDLSQPISALRIAVDEMQRSQKGGEHLSRAVDYIASLAHSYIEEGIERQAPESSSDDDQSTKEIIDTVMFADSLRQMFTDDAGQRGITLTIICPHNQVVLEPLSTLRVMSNLIGNAIRHSQANRILLGFRPRNQRIVFQVHDNGRGMDDETLAAALEPLNKGDKSSGYGLGLGIVRELSQAQGLNFRIDSSLGHGTSAYIELPRANHQARKDRE